MTPEDAAAVVFDLVRDGYTATDGGVTVVVSGTSLSGSAVTMTLNATRDGAALTLENPFVFVNPPVAIADGEDVLVDPEAALVEMLVQAVA